MLPGQMQGEGLSEMCVSKPFSVTELKERLESLLERETSGN
jgi:hypothetical protein